MPFVLFGPHALSNFGCASVSRKVKKTHANQSEQHFFTRSEKIRLTNLQKQQLQKTFSLVCMLLVQFVSETVFIPCDNCKIFFIQVYCYSAAFFNRHVVTIFLKSVQKEFYILSPSSPQNHIGPTNFIFDNFFQSLSFPEWSTFFFMNGNSKPRQRHIFCYELKSNFCNMVTAFISSFYKAKTKSQSTWDLRANNN